jgi:dTDP-4-amino-4,6-dideoxygalactose transaminase/ribosomal protein S18 acetylase RimI-like enzyme
MLPLFKVFMSPDASQNLTPILESGYIAQGPQVELFEKALQEYFSYPYILTLNSATSGLTLAIRLLNLSSGDEVISTPLTCTATTWPILANGCKVKWADVDPRNCNVDLESVRAKITEKTKAIMVVHWGGYPVDLDGLKQIVDEAEEKYGNRIPIVEDCAHAFGAKYKGKMIGTHGNTCVFSLQAIKHLTTGDGGLIFLPNEESYKRAKLLRWFGIDRERRSGGGDLRMENDVPEWGYKFHMNDINASIGLSNLPFVEENTQKMRNIANRYRKEFPQFGVELLEEKEGYESARWIFTIKVHDKCGFIPFMNSKGIMVSQVHNRNDNHSCVAESKTSLPQLDELEKSIICIPAGWWITYENQTYIIDCIKEWYPKVIFRELIADDWTEYLTLLSQLTQYSYPEVNSPEKFGEILEKIHSQNASIIVGTLKGKMVCTGKVLIELKFGKSVAHIEDVVVHSQHRDKGIGRLLLTELTQNKDVYKIVLVCKPELSTFYEKNGFVNTGSQMLKRM